MQIDGFEVDGIANIERANLRIEDLSGQRGQVSVSRWLKGTSRAA